MAINLQNHLFKLVSYLLTSRLCSFDLKLSLKRKNGYNITSKLVNLPWIHRPDDQFHAGILLLTLAFPVHIPDIPHEKQTSAPILRDMPATDNNRC